MFFTIKNNYNISAEKFKIMILFNARRKILLYRTGANELKIDEYLNKNYHTNLKMFCLDVLNNILITNNNKNEFIVKITNKEMNDIARVITYGNGEFQGSKILRVALS